MTSCTKEEEIIKDLKLSEMNVSLLMKEKKDVRIIDGNGSYVAKASNGKIKVSTKANVISIEGVDVGEATVTVTDAKKKTVKISVKISAKDVGVKESQVSIKKGSMKNVEITTGSGSYEVSSSDKKIATAVLKGSNVEITAVKKGNATVTVKDTKTNKTVNITVEVTIDALAVSEENVTVKKGETKEVEITAGSGNYTVISENEDIATIVQEGTKITITAVKKGNATIVVTDTEGEVTKNITVEVTVDDLAIQGIDEDVIVKEGKTKTLSITAGSGVYEVTSSDESAATATLNNETKEIVIEGKEGGENYTEKTTVVTVTDTESGKKKEFTVKVFKKLSIGRSKLTIIQGNFDSTPIISGNLAAIEFVLDDASKKCVDVEIVDGTYSGKEIKITTKKPGEATIIVKDGEEEKTITVTVEQAPDLKVTDYYSQEVEEITLKLDDPDEGMKLLSIEGSGQYEFTEYDSNIITVGDVQDNFFEITAKGGGTTTIKITDKVTNQTKNLNVVVEEDEENGSTGDVADVNIDENGVVTKKDGVTYEGAIVLPSNAKKIPSYYEPKTPFKENSAITSIDFGGVTEIELMALMNCTGLEKIKLREVTTIAIGAFTYCSSLTKVYCYMATPPSVGQGSFEGVASGAILYVPAGTKAAYEAVAEFSSKFTIEEM